MHKMTSANLHNAYGGESMAYMRYQIWGNQAQQEGFANVARLYRAISVAETIHATNHFMTLKDQTGDSLCNSAAVFGFAKTSQNLQGSIDGETFEVNEMYPAYLATAKRQTEKGAERTFLYAMSAEKTHATLFQKAKTAIDGGKDMELGAVHVCPVCGWTHEGQTPEVCPICGSKKFHTFA